MQSLRPSITDLCLRAIVTLALLYAVLCPALGDTIQIKNIQPKPQYDLLPKFYTSDPAYDAFVNEYFMRHLSVEDSGVYAQGGVCLGIIDMMWVTEWDCWMLPWIDRGAMGAARQSGSTRDVVLTGLTNCAVDKYGYVLGAALRPEPRDAMGGYCPLFGWPWPKYDRDYTSPKPHGWEFNNIGDGARDQWIARDVELEPGYVDHSLVGKITGRRPWMISPWFDADVFQVPVIELDITYKGADADKAINGLKIYWTTDKSPRFSEDRMVTADFCTLPPRDFPGDYAPFVSSAEARYPLYFPMFLHREWGRSGRRITRLKIVPTGPGAEGVTVSLNYVRASYDVRLSTTNATLINAAYKFFMWNGDDDFLAAMMPKLRKSITFLNEHIKGREEALLDWGWSVGKDGIGNQPGHGIYGSYWDLLPGGLYDLESSAEYYCALSAMAELEEAAKKRGISVPDVQVLGPDNATLIPYRETPASLRSVASRVRKRIERDFWNPETGRFVRNIDISGKKHDYGFLHFNLLTLALGIGTPAQRDSIVSWLNGRVVPGDTSTGADIYHWRFAPRTSTRRNDDYYYWPWVSDHKNSPSFAWQFEFGNQMQDGGAVGFTSLFDLMARVSTGDQREIDKAFDRTKEVWKWFEDVKAAGGKGTEFYRAYYDNHPERGRPQSPLPGGLGLDREFLSDGSLGTEFLFHAFLGIDSKQDGVISVAPAIPSKLDKIGVTNVCYRGNHLRIEAGRGYVSFEGSDIPNGAGLKARITLRNAPKGSLVTIDGKPTQANRQRDGSIVVLADLRPVRVEVK